MRSARKLQIICEPNQPDGVFGETKREEIHAILEDLGMPVEARYGAFIQYVNNYLYLIEAPPPREGSKLRTIMAGRAEEYYQDIKIRDPAAAQGGGTNETLPADKRGKRTTPP